MKLLEKLDIEIQSLRDKIISIEAMREKLAPFAPALDDTYLAKRLSLTGTVGIDFDRPSRQEVALALATFTAGKWEKTIASVDSPAITYESPHFFAPNMPLRLWAAEPPPSCRIEYEEIMVPARTERRAKLVCKEPEPAPAVEPQPIDEVPA